MFSSTWEEILLLEVFFLQCFVCWFACRTTPSSAGPKSTSIPVSPVSGGGSARFPRNTTTRSTFHGGAIRDRRQPLSNAYNGPGGAPMTTQDTSAMGQQGPRSFFNKLTSKFSRRYGPDVNNSTFVFITRFLVCVWKEWWCSMPVAERNLHNVCRHIQSWSSWIPTVPCSAFSSCQKHKPLPEKACISRNSKM